MEALPRLVPVYSHRYLPAEPAQSPAPVFSIYQTDAIYYGENLDDYLAREFGGPERRAPVRPAVRVRFWSELAEGLEDADL